MAQLSISSLEDLHTRWGPPPPTLDSAAVAYLCNGLTLERNSSLQLGLRRRQGWKMAQQVLAEVAAALIPSPTTAPSPPEPLAEDDKVPTPLPLRSSTAPNHILTPESLDRLRPLARHEEKKKDYSAYLDMLMTPSPTPTERKAAAKQSPSSPSSSITTTTTTSDDDDDDTSKASTTTTPSPAQTTTTKHPLPTSASDTPPNSEQEEPDPAKTLHPLLLARLNAAWSNLLDLDLASRSVEHRVARDLGALRRLRGAALDALLEELVVVRGHGHEASAPLPTMMTTTTATTNPEGSSDGGAEEGEEGGHAVVGEGEGEYTAAMRALGGRFGEGDGEAVLGEWMGEEGKREVEEEGIWGLDWEGVGKARDRVERELVERGLLEYESE